MLLILIVLFHLCHLIHVFQSRQYLTNHFIIISFVITSVFQVPRGLIYSGSNFNSLVSIIAKTELHKMPRLSSICGCGRLFIKNRGPGLVRVLVRPLLL